MVTVAIGAWSARADDALYRGLGERVNLVRIVDYATDLWLVDRRIKDTFDNLNIERVKSRLVDQLCCSPPRAETQPGVPLEAADE